MGDWKCFQKTKIKNILIMFFLLSSSHLKDVLINTPCQLPLLNIS